MLSYLDNKSDQYKTALNGMGFGKAHKKEFEKARKIYLELRKIAQSNLNDQDEHIAIHQLGMVERMAENYSKSQELNIQDGLVIR